MLNKHQIALQFPDELLHDSVPIYRHLKAMVGHRELYVLADTSYGRYSYVLHRWFNTYKCCLVKLLRRRGRRRAHKSDGYGSLWTCVYEPVCAVPLR